MDEYFGKVVLINFGVLLATLLISLMLSYNDAGDLFMNVIFFQPVVNLVGGLVLLFIRRWRKMGQAMLLSSFLMPLIGVGLCMVRFKSDF